MITKDFIIVKDFCTYSIRILRQGKILHDHGPDRGRLHLFGGLEGAKSTAVVVRARIRVVR
jgi:hypothetical protein